MEKIKQTKKILPNNFISFLLHSFFTAYYLKMVKNKIFQIVLPLDESISQTVFKYLKS